MMPPNVSEGSSAETRRRTPEAPSSPKGIVSARPFVAWGLVRVHLADRGRRAHAVGQGAAKARRRSSASRSSTSRPAATSARSTIASCAWRTPSSSCASRTTSARPSGSSRRSSQEATTAGDAPLRHARVSPSVSPPRSAATISRRSSDSKPRVNEHAVPPPHLRPDLYTTLGQSYAALGAPTARCGSSRTASRECARTSPRTGDRTSATRRS